jgi:hypothetical protein
MAWKTGSKSPGDALMTWSTSDVAVCCSRDSRNSLSSRVFSMDGPWDGHYLGRKAALLLIACRVVEMVFAKSGDRDDAS